MREVLKEDIEFHKETIDKIKDICYEYKVSRKSGYNNKELIQKLKIYVINLCVARSVIDEKQYAFTYRYISERIIGWWVHNFQISVINRFNLRRLFNQNSRIGISELNYKNKLKDEILVYHSNRTSNTEYIDNIGHLIVLLWSLRDTYNHNYIVSSEELIKITKLSKININKVLRKYNINTKRKGIK